jgi:hypothetical protein
MENEEELLIHYGVLGMRWGHHRSRAPDTVLKKGTKFQRITTNANSGFTKGVYASYKNADKDLYKGVLGRMRVTSLLKENGEMTIKELTMTTKKDIKIPSKQARMDEFKALYESDRKGVMALINEHEASRYNRKSSNEFDSTNQGHVSTMYEKFNDSLALGTNSQNGKVIQKYYNRLSKKGYDAIPDENDIRLSTFKAQAPLILFNTKKSIGETYVRDLSASEIFKAYDRSIIPKTARHITMVGNIGFERLTPNSRKEINAYSKQLYKDKFALDSKYTLKDLAEDWGKNRLSSHQIQTVSKKMEEGKTHEEAVKETLIIGNTAVSYVLDRLNL